MSVFLMKKKKIMKLKKKAHFILGDLSDGLYLAFTVAGMA